MILYVVGDDRSTCVRDFYSVEKHRLQNYLSLSVFFLPICIYLLSKLSSVDEKYGVLLHTKLVNVSPVANILHMFLKSW